MLRRLRFALKHFRPTPRVSLLSLVSYRYYSQNDPIQYPSAAGCDEWICQRCVVAFIESQMITVLKPSTRQEHRQVLIAVRVGIAQATAIEHLGMKATGVKATGKSYR